MLRKTAINTNCESGAEGSRTRCSIAMENPNLFLDTFTSMMCFYLWFGIRKFRTAEYLSVVRNLEIPNSGKSMFHRNILVGKKVQLRTHSVGVPCANNKPLSKILNRQKAFRQFHHIIFFYVII